MRTGNNCEFCGGSPSINLSHIEDMVTGFSEDRRPKVARLCLFSYFFRASLRLWRPCASLMMLTSLVASVWSLDLVVAQPSVPPRFLVCLQFQAVVAGLNPEELTAAILVEGRKIGANLTVTTGEHSGGCANSSVQMTIDADDVRITGLLFGETVVSLAPIEPVDRAPRLAEWVASKAAASDTASEFLLTTSERSDPWSMRPILVRTEPADLVVDAPGFQLRAIVGGRYVYAGGPSIHLGGAEAALEVGLLQDALAFRISGAWIPSQSTHTTPNATWSAGEFGVSAWGGFRWNLLKVGAGVTLGWEWRTLSVDSAHRFDPPETSASIPWIGGELELAADIRSPWWIAIAVGGRGYPTGDTLKWAEQPWMSSMNGAFLVALRTGVVLW